jgi:hypothetical protein
VAQIVCESSNGPPIDLATTLRVLTLDSEIPLPIFNPDHATEPKRLSRDDWNIINAFGYVKDNIVTKFLAWSARWVKEFFASDGSRAS